MPENIGIWTRFIVKKEGQCKPENERIFSDSQKA